MADVALFVKNGMASKTRAELQLSGCAVWRGKAFSPEAFTTLGYRRANLTECHKCCMLSTGGADSFCVTVCLHTNASYWKARDDK